MDLPTVSDREDDGNLMVMMAGSNLIKIRSWRKKKQHFRLFADSMTIMYRSNKGFFGKGGCSTISAAELESVREGHQSELFADTVIAAEFPEDLCFTLVFRGRQPVLDLVAESPEEAQAWIQGVRTLIKQAEDMGESESRDQMVWDWFQKADKNADGLLEFKETCKLLKMMNIEMEEDHVFRYFTMADKSPNHQGLDIEEFVQFYRMLTQRDEVWSVFQEYSEDEDNLTIEELESFLVQEQNGERSAEEAKELIMRYEPSDENKNQKVMSVEGFKTYLFSQDDGSIFKPSYRGLYQDMNKPLSHYFISTSHNTYLMADQLVGPSSIEAYIQAFKRGCRCIEVDCWDGSDGQPVVYHGHTLTSKILYKDVIDTIGEYAFMASDFPVIISIENHCSVEQQTIMAQYLDEILGDKLLKIPLDGVPENLPSPYELTGKILVKAKKIGRLEADDSLSSAEGSDGEDDDDTSDDGDSESEARKRSDSRSTATLSSELSDLVVYCKSVPFRGFQSALQNYECYEMSSFSENKAKKLVQDEGADYVRHNTKHLSRIYPKGLRTDSSNFRPHEMWNGGCQLVALNFQTAGISMDLNDGLFAQNGGSGYVLKPDFMRDESTDFDPERPQDLEGYYPLRLSIRVISGQQLPKVKERSIVDPLVRVEIYGVPKDSEQQKETLPVRNNGFNPVWNETLVFDVHIPELALVRFVVEDNEMVGMANGFIGQFTLPFDCIQVGYRHINLLSEDGTDVPQASLFVHVKIENYVSEDVEM